MPDDLLDQDAWLARIGYSGSRAPTLATLQRKMIGSRRGGYCFEQNMLFRGGLRSLGFDVTSFQARVVRGLAIDAPRPMFHMVLQVNLPEGPYLADVGFGNVAPTAPLQLTVDVEQDTPHEVMRFIRMGDELTLQSRLGEWWEHIYRVVFLPRLDAEYEICNWFTASHPDNIHGRNLIVARPGPNRTRITLFNARLSVRHASGAVERRMLADRSEYCDVLTETFGVVLSDEELATALETVAQKGAQGAPHPSFA